METRVDLAQLFCMIARHGPAVAVMAMASVVAGFIIYRSVRRRKAAAGSPGAGVTELQETPTDLSEDDLLDMNITNGTRSPGNLRKRRTAETTSASPRLDASHALDSSSIAEKCANVAWTVEDVCNLSLPDDETSKDAEEIQSSCFTPVETSAGHETEEVPKAQEVGLIVNNVLKENPSEMENKLASNSPTCPENTPANQNQDEGQKENQTIDVDSCLEEPVICMAGVILSSKDETKETPHKDRVKFSDGNICSSSENVESVPLTTNAHDQQMTLDHVIGYSTSKQQNVSSLWQGQCEDVIMLGAHDGVLDANCSPFSEVIEKDIDEDHLKHLTTASPVTLEHKNQEHVSEHTDDPSCNQEDSMKGVTSSFEECDGSHGISIALPCLNPVELETMLDQELSVTEAELCGFAPVYFQQEVTCKYAVSPNLPEDTSLDGLMFDLPEDPSLDGLTYESGSLQMEKRETVTDVVVPELSLDDLLSSRDAEVCSVMPSFQNQECEQVQIEDFSEVSTVPIPDMAESITMCQGQLLSFEHGELTTSSSSGVGEESGISSMTVSPDLPDMGCDMTPVSMAFSVTGQYPVSKEHVEYQWNFLAEEVKFVSKDIPAEVSHELCPSHELAHSEHTASALPTTEEMEENSQTDHLIARVVAIVMDELQNEMDTKAVLESEQKEMAEKDKLTEINIMEATMDVNEWITDGSHEVPWINLSVSSPHNTQTASASSGHRNSVPVDSSSKNADPLFKQSSITNEGKGSDKKVVAVQPMPQNVKVTFRIHYLTNSPYQKVAITGNQQELGNWKGFLPLEKSKEGHWSVVLNLPAESHVEWKFVVVNQGEVCRWEECGNRVLDTGSVEDLLVHKWWGSM